MSKQYLVPVKDTEDANNAIARIPDVVEKGDEVFVLVISEIPEGELIGSTPPPHVIDPLATTGGTASAGRAGADQPVFLSREEIMDARGQELREALEPQVASLHDRGFKARVEAVFSDDPGETIRDYAGDLNVSDVYITGEFHSDLDSQTQEVVKTL